MADAALFYVEHWTRRYEVTAFATRRASTISEANGRAALFLASVSMPLVAFAFLAQSTGLDAVFYLFLYVLLACLIMPGLMTFDRVAQTGLEDNFLLRGEARVRRFYADIAPDLRDRFMLPVENDQEDALKVAGRTQGRILLTTAAMVAVVNTTLAGALTGLLAGRTGTALWVAAMVGIAVFAVTMVLHGAWHLRLWHATEVR